MLANFLLFVLYISCGVRSLAPPSDACVVVGTPVPPECPAQDTAPCPPCFVNEFPDYVRGDNTSIPSSMKIALRAAIESEMKYWISEHPPSSYNYYDIIDGAAGIALIFLRLHQNGFTTFNNNGLTIQTLSLAQGYLKIAFDSAPNGLIPLGFGRGNIGLWSIAKNLADITGDTTSASKYVNLIQNQFAQVNMSVSQGKPYDGYTDYTLFNGYVGMLYAGIELITYTGDKGLLDPRYFKSMVSFIITEGMKTGASRGHDYMEFIDNGCYKLGMDNGVGGIVKLLIDTAEHILPSLWKDPTFVSPITKTLNHLTSIQLPDGNMPTATGNDPSNNGLGSCTKEYGNDPDRRVQWDHGGSGFINAFASAAVHFQNDLNNNVLADKYFESAWRAYNATWKRGLLAKGMMYCHGTGGNAYTMWIFGEYLKKYKSQRVDIPFLINQSAWRSMKFASWMYNATARAHSHIPCVVPMAMWQSSWGTSVLFGRMLEDNWPNVDTCMPGYTYCRKYI